MMAGLSLVGIEIDSKRTARQGMGVLSGDESVGRVTSGCMSPTLNKSIAMAYVDSSVSEPGSKVAIDAGRTQLEGTIVSLPFYKAPKPAPKTS